MLKDECPAETVLLTLRVVLQGRINCTFPSFYCDLILRNVWNLNANLQGEVGEYSLTCL